MLPVIKYVNTPVEAVIELFVFPDKLENVWYNVPELYTSMV